MRKVLPVIICCVLAAATLSFAQVLNFTSYSTEDGLPQLQVLTVCQDKEGYIWFGTFAGAVKFNGVDFELYTVDDGLVNNTVLRIVTDDEGAIYFATIDGISTYRNGTWKNYRIDDPAHDYNNKIEDLRLDKDGVCWFVNATGLHKVLGEEIISFAVPQEYENVTFNSLYCDADGQMWLGSDSGVFKFDEDNSYKKVQFDREISSTVNDLIHDYHGNLLLLTSEGLYRVESEKLVKVEIAGISPTAVYTSALSDKLNNIMLGTSLGLVVMNHSYQDVITKKNGLPNDYINHLYLDREENIWIGTNDGISYLKMSGFTHYNSSSGLADDGVVDVYEDSKNRLWILGDRRGITVFENEKIWYLSEKDGLPTSYTYTICEDDNNRMVIGLRDHLCLWNEGEISTLISEIRATQLFRDSQGRVWIPHYSGMKIWRNNRLENFVFPDEMGSIRNSIFTVAEDSSGRMWFGTRYDGIFIFDGDEVVHLDQDSGLSSQMIWCIERAIDGTMWIGTNGDGLFSYAGGKIKQYTTENGLQDNVIWMILPALNGDVWIWSNTGIDRLQADAVHHYSLDDGLMVEEGSLRAGEQDSAGRLWFGSQRGLHLYNSAFDNEIAFDPQLKIESVSINGKEINYTATNNFSANENYVSFKVAALTYRFAKDLRLEYKMSGRGNSWQKVDPGRMVRFYNLQPGNYTFSLRAVYRDHVKTADPYIFVIQPPFYQTWWFFFIMAIIAIAGVLLTIHNRTRRFEQERKILDHLVNERTTELAVANKELKAFTTAVSNNLKVPLRHMQGFCIFMKEELESRNFEKAEKRLSGMEENVYLINSMIDDLHKLSKSNEIPVQNETIDLSMLSRAVNGDIQRMYPDRSPKVVIEEGVIVQGTFQLLWMVLQNLISNAWKATVSRGEDAKIEIGQTYIGKKQVLYVRDNGIGFDSTLEVELFKPFSLVHGKNDFPGTGLGLVSVQRIIMRMGGEIWAIGKPDEGATFYFTLGYKANPKFNLVKK